LEYGSSCRFSPSAAFLLEPLQQKLCSSSDIEIEFLFSSSPKILREPQGFTGIPGATRLHQVAHARRRLPKRSHIHRQQIKPPAVFFHLTIADASAHFLYRGVARRI